MLDKKNIKLKTIAEISLAHLSVSQRGEFPPPNFKQSLEELFNSNTSDDPIPKLPIFRGSAQNSALRLYTNDKQEILDVLQRHEEFSTIDFSPGFMLPLPSEISSSKSELFIPFPVTVFSPVIVPMFTSAPVVLGIIEGGGALNSNQLKIVQEFFVLHPNELSDEIVAPWLLKQLKNNRVLFQNVMSIFAYHRKECFKKILINLLSTDLLNEQALESMFLFMATCSIENEYLDAFMNTCFQQLKKTSTTLLKSKLGLFWAFLQKITKEKMYEFSRRADLWEKYADLFPGSGDS